ncbi:dUTPase [Aquibacillus halophilus]|uniref:dUTPase n=1 Tax=Aquibacillus halophilus TaxID=930132 RepID=A0A6A8DBC5_9BACI|nr:dUTP diphosphatase [Aquibacillus halophilus]MRH42908.1 dUTPase [Aquibacillus halophilus]
MEWSHLFNMQKQLDSYIESNHQLDSIDLFDKKVLALLVEVGELANETRCFKFWSKKAPSENKVILEEYVDGLHFILSLGLDKNLTFNSAKMEGSFNITDHFNNVFKEIIAFKSEPSKEKYNKLFNTYIALGSKLGFDEKSVQAAYFEKNKVNHERQDKGY